jgi:hypothetical protein
VKTNHLNAEKTGLAHADGKPGYILWGAVNAKGYIMTGISKEIEYYKTNFLNHPLFNYLNDDALSLDERLRFLPYISHFVMSFADINKYILPFATPANALERAVNTHAREDAEHWPWFLNDLQTSGQNSAASLTEHLSFLWSDNLINSRKLTYHLIQTLHNQSAKMRLIVIEVMEATGNATFDTLASITKGTDKQLEYCGHLHLSHETGHSMGSEDEIVDTLNLTEEERNKASQMIAECFNAFHRFFDEIFENVSPEHSRSIK